MSLFNSLGSNYNFSFVIQSLLMSPNSQSYTKLKSFLKTKYQAEQVILFYKGRQAIQTGLKILKLKPDSEVAITAFTCFAVYDAIVKAGLKSHLLDINHSLNFSPATLKNDLQKNPQIKAVIVQNSLGYPQDMESIQKICQNNNVVLIEDLAHSVGSRYSPSQEAGTVGDLAILSFSQDKIIDAVSGGALVIHNKRFLMPREINLATVSYRRQVVDRLYPILTYLIRNSYSFGLGKILHKVSNYLHLLSLPMTQNSNQPQSLSPWYCQLVLNQFQNLTQNLTHRQNTALIYAQLLDKKILSPQIISQIPHSSNLRFPIFVENPHSLIKFLKKFAIFVSDIWYDAPIAPKKYSNLADYNQSVPNSKKLCAKLINLPTHQSVNPKQAELIAEKVNLWLKLSANTK